MSDALWTRLAAAFPASAVVSDLATVEAGEVEALPRPRLAGEAVRRRLDEVCGVEGWSVEFTPFDEGSVGCAIEVAGVRKAAVVDARLEGAAATADAALAAAALLLGMTAPVGTEEGASLVPEGAPEATGAADVLEADARSRGLSNEGLRMIDRLVERLKEEGQGLAAARLLVRYGGYGKDTAAARELYGELRALLRRSSEDET